MRSALSYGIVCALSLGLTTAAGRGDDQKKPEKPSLMKQKLAASQKLLEGLALNDFALIKTNAETLNDISKQAAWKLIETPRYAIYSEEFQRITLKMANEAKKRNLDSAALSYVDMTLMCVKCHQHVREIRIGRGDKADDVKKFFGE